MATKSYVSPGVFTNEIDASFLGPGVGSIGAAIIGTAPIGPAFVPVTVSTFSEFTSFFGDLSTDHLLGYAARAYLKNAGTANVLRVLGPEGRTVGGAAVTAGYSAESMWSINAFTGSSGVVMSLLEITASADLVITDLTNDEFFVEISGTGGSGYDPRVAVTASFLSGSPSYISKVLNTDPTLFSSLGYYVREVYDYAIKSTVGGNALYNSSSHAVITNFAFGYNSGSTPWIKSQLFGGASEYNMFRVHTLGHGEGENGRFKISIRNVRASAAPQVTSFGKFDLEIRTFNDTDRNRSVVESYPNLTMDPLDPNYVVRAIGDKFFLYDVNRGKTVEYGDYDNRSKLIRIELTTGSLPDAALPWGYRGLAKPNVSISASSGFGVVGSALPDLPLTKDLKDKETQSEAQTYIHWGLETQLSGNTKARFDRFSAMTGSDADFSMALISGSSADLLVYNASNPANSRKSPGDSTSATSLESALAKFTVPIAFGSDGFDRRLANPLQNNTQLVSVSQLGTQALRQAVDIISDPDFIDINLLALPGIVSSKVVDYAINAVQTRADAFYIMDITGSTSAAVIQEVKGRGFDTNYAGVYYPDIRVRDDVNGQAKTLPSSIPALGVYAFTDRISQPWFAPAGLNRAGLSRDTIGFDVLSITDQLKQDERDSLYENRINPIARFPDVPQGVIWGQKTLQLKASALDRINVRRLLIKAKKLVASATKFLVFEPNNPTTQTRFKQLVNPILAEIQQKQGLEKFFVVMDETTNTPDLIDRNVLAGKIFLVPTRTAEFVTIDFIISKSGAQFSE